MEEISHDMPRDCSKLVNIMKSIEIEVNPKPLT